jgi:hypothetical protein
MRGGQFFSDRLNTSSGNLPVPAKVSGMTIAPIQPPFASSLAGDAFFSKTH